MPDTTMTIAQALRRIKDLKGQVGLHVRNAQQSVTHVTLAAPAYSFSEEWEKAQQKVGELLDLQERLAIANATTMIPGLGRGGSGRSLSWATKKLAEIKGAIALFEGLPVRAQEKTVEVREAWSPAASASAAREIEYTCHLPEKKRAEAVERMRADFSTLNDLVETYNHRTFI